MHSSRLASPLRMAVSLSNSRNVESFLPDADIKVSISCSVGTNGNFSATTHRGFSHDILLNFTNISGVYDVSSAVVAPCLPSDYVFDRPFIVKVCSSVYENLQCYAVQTYGFIAVTLSFHM